MAKEINHPVYAAGRWEGSQVRILSGSPFFPHRLRDAISSALSGLRAGGRPCGRCATVWRAPV